MFATDIEVEFEKYETNSENPMEKYTGTKLAVDN
jgi:hypothetical protein